MNTIEAVRGNPMPMSVCLEAWISYSCCYSSAGSWEPSVPATRPINHPGRRADNPARHVRASRKRA
jgi:hypothetical protein